MIKDFDREIERDYKKQAFLRDNGKCRYCGIDFLSSLSLFWAYTVDHVVARSEKGPDTFENVVTCCSSCNGALSRVGHLKTFDQRSEYVRSQIPSRSEIYELWKHKLRSKKYCP
jgi:5-methylcytosine-specific restriction endonuclease McrA